MIKHFEDFTVEDLGIQEQWVYDIEVENNHNFFANNILVHNSNYVCMDEVYKSCNTGESFLEFSLGFEKNVLSNLLENCMKIFADKYNTKPILNFKREKIILKEYVQCKKKYITQIIANEKKIYKEPTIKITGIEINKSDLCKFSKKKLSELCEIMFNGDIPDKKRMTEHIRKSFEEFKKQHPTDIATPKGVKDYDKYSVTLDATMNNFITKTPIHNRASILYNHIIKDLKLPYMEIFNGTKLKYIYVKSNNKYKTDVVGFVGNWPKEFETIFQVDYEKQFEKQFKQIAQRFYDVLKYSEITLKDSKLLSLIEDD